MFTRNYFKYKQMMFTCTNVSGFVCYDGVTRIGQVEKAYRDDLASSYTRVPKIGTPDTTASTKDTQNMNAGVFFGTGITPPTVDDYALESPITSGLSARESGYAIYKEKEGLYVYEQRIELTNTSDANIGISEIGIVSSVAYVTSSATAFYATLFDRTVLDEPIHIAPGETRLVTYRINFNQTAV